MNTSENLLIFLKIRVEDGVFHKNYLPPKLSPLCVAKAGLRWSRAGPAGSCCRFCRKTPPQKSSPVSGFRSSPSWLPFCPHRRAVSVAVVYNRPSHRPSSSGKEKPSGNSWVNLGSGRLVPARRELQLQEEAHLPAKSFGHGRRAKWGACAAPTWPCLCRTGNEPPGCGEGDVECVCGRRGWELPWQQNEWVVS